MYGDVGAVVVEDGAGAVDDFLVALDLCHDFLLHLQRRQGDLDSTQIRGLHASLIYCLLSEGLHRIDEAVSLENPNGIVRVDS